MKKITIIDYGLSNLLSVYNALTYLGCKVKISNKPEIISKSNILILPGVGSFSKAMASLKYLKIDKAILDAVSDKKNKLLGICLGMQLLAEKGYEEEETDGLGLIKGTVERFNKDITKKIPHIGFDSVIKHPRSILFENLGSISDFYFVHSYKIDSNNREEIIGKCYHGENFIASYEKDNIFATQFHPEKSQTNGLRLLHNFIN